MSVFSDEQKRRFRNDYDLGGYYKISITCGFSDQEIANGILTSLEYKNKLDLNLTQRRILLDLIYKTFRIHLMKVKDFEKIVGL